MDNNNKPFVYLENITPPGTTPTLFVLVNLEVGYEILTTLQDHPDGYQYTPGQLVMGIWTASLDISIHYSADAPGGMYPTGAPLMLYLGSNDSIVDVTVTDYTNYPTVKVVGSSKGIHQEEADTKPFDPSLLTIG